MSGSTGERVAGARSLPALVSRYSRSEEQLAESSVRTSLTSGRQDDGLAGRLRVEEPVGFLGLLEPPAVREEPLHVHLPVGDELGALGPGLASRTSTAPPALPAGAGDPG